MIQNLKAEKIHNENLLITPLTSHPILLPRSNQYIHSVSLFVIAAYYFCGAGVYYNILS